MVSTLGQRNPTRLFCFQEDLKRGWFSISNFLNCWLVSVQSDFAKLHFVTFYSCRGNFVPGIRDPCLVSSLELKITIYVKITIYRVCFNCLFPHPQFDPDQGLDSGHDLSWPKKAICSIFSQPIIGNQDAKQSKSCTVSNCRDILGSFPFQKFLSLACSWCWPMRHWPKTESEGGGWLSASTAASTSDSHC